MKNIVIIGVISGLFLVIQNISLAQTDSKTTYIKKGDKVYTIEKTETATEKVVTDKKKTNAHLGDVDENGRLIKTKSKNILEWQKELLHRLALQVVLPCLMLKEQLPWAKMELE